MKGETPALGKALPVLLGHPGARLSVVAARQQAVLRGMAYKTALLNAYYRPHQPLLCRFYQVGARAGFTWPRPAPTPHHRHKS